MQNFVFVKKFDVINLKILQICKHLNIKMSRLECKSKFLNNKSEFLDSESESWDVLQEVITLT